MWFVFILNVRERWSIDALCEDKSSWVPICGHRSQYFVFFGVCINTDSSFTQTQGCTLSMQCGGKPIFIRFNETVSFFPLSDFKVAFLHIVLWSQGRYPDASFLLFLDRTSLMNGFWSDDGLYCTYTIKAPCVKAPQYVILQYNYFRNVTLNGTDFLRDYLIPHLQHHFPLTWHWQWRFKLLFTFLCWLRLSVFLDEQVRVRYDAQMATQDPWITVDASLCRQRKGGCTGVYCSIVCSSCWSILTE